MASVASVEYLTEPAAFYCKHTVAACSRAWMLAQKIWALLPEVYAVLTGMVPNRLCWCWRTKVTGTITGTSLHCRINKAAYRAELFYHGDARKSGMSRRDRMILALLGKFGNLGGHPILFLHGDDGGSPADTLHLIDRAVRARKGPVYSLCVDYQDKYPEPHQRLIDLAIARISEDNPDTTVIGVGYSHGCAEWAHRVYVRQHLNQKKVVRKLILIAGRLKLTQDRGPKPDKVPLIRAIEKARLLYPNDFPLYQISAGTGDWCIPSYASIVEPGKRSRLIPDTMHINLVFDTRMWAAFDEFLNEASHDLSRV